MMIRYLFNLHLVCVCFLSNSNFLHHICSLLNCFESIVVCFFLSHHICGNGCLHCDIVHTFWNVVVFSSRVSISIQIRYKFKARFNSDDTAQIRNKIIELLYSADSIFQLNHLCKHGKKKLYYRNTHTHMDTHIVMPKQCIESCGVRPYHEMYSTQFVFTVVEIV